MRGPKLPRGSKVQRFGQNLGSSHEALTAFLQRYNGASGAPGAQAPPEQPQPPAPPPPAPPPATPPVDTRHLPGGDAQGLTPAPQPYTSAKLPDAQDPAALEYARERLALLARSGYKPGDFGITGNDPAAIWRAISPLAGILAAIRGGHAADYKIPAGINPQVLAMVQKLIEAATQNDTGGSGPVRPGAAV